MKQVKGVQYSIILLLLINFQPLYTMELCIYRVTNYVISKGQMILLLGRIKQYFKSPDQIFFWYSIIFCRYYFLYLPIKCIQLRKKMANFFKMEWFEIVLMIGHMVTKSVIQWNNIISFLVIYSIVQRFQDSDSKRSWIIFYFLEFF